MRVLVWAALAAMLMLAPAHAQETDASALEGYWASEPVGIGQASAPLTITRNGEGWRAEMNGAEAQFEGEGDALRFSFPDSQAVSAARSPKADGSSRVFGFSRPARMIPADRWLRRLSLRAPHAMSGEVKCSLWRMRGRSTCASIAILKSGLVAAFRNPERNDIGGASRFRVSRDGEAISFFVPYDGGELRREAQLIAPDRLRVNLTGEPVEADPHDG